MFICESKPKQWKNAFSWGYNIHESGIRWWYISKIYAYCTSFYFIQLHIFWVHYRAIFTLNSACLQFDLSSYIDVMHNGALLLFHTHLRKKRLFLLLIIYIFLYVQNTVPQISSSQILINWIVMDLTSTHVKPPHYASVAETTILCMAHILLEQYWTIVLKWDRRIINYRKTSLKNMK